MVRASWLLALPLVFAFGCGSGPEVQSSDDLTSKSAVERELTLKAYVFVDENANSYTVEDAVQQQVRTAFGPLRIGKISVDDREFRNNIDPSTFQKTVIDVVKQETDGSRTVVKKVARVGYTYKARALVEKSLSSQSLFSTALLMGEYQSFVSDIIKDCVENYAEDQEFASSFWYVWSPGEYACKQRIEAEVDALNQERQGLTDKQIGEKELARRFLPVTIELKEVAAAKVTYPEYDRLYGINDSTRNRIVVYQILGVAAHSTDPIDNQHENDMGFKEYFKLTKVLADSFKSLRVAADSEANPLSIAYGGKTYSGTFEDLYDWTVDQSNFPSDIADTRAFRRAIHDTIKMKWVTLEVPLTVSSARGAKKMTLEIRLIFGTEGDWSDRNIWREAFKNADVALYDGHSYIGAGPLDPSNYSAGDFNDRYQIFVFNSCVSFNYYGVNYFKLKSGGTANLELVTNGLEVWIDDGGKSMGQFIAALFDGKQNSWLSMLEKTAISTYWGVHDPNRNVDGELDNTYDPATNPITVTEGNAPTPPPPPPPPPEPPADSLFSDTMESGTANWTATGLWHLAQNSTCASPAYASPVSAWYFGQDDSCDYQQSSGAAQGTLTSKLIAGISATSKLSFKFYREVENGASGSYDQTKVEVQADGSTSWKSLWSKDSTNASSKEWVSSGELSLAAYAGKSVRIRFSFDSVDGYDNAHAGWLIDDVLITP